jgi:hypothetical protein
MGISIGFEERHRIPEGRESLTEARRHREGMNADPGWFSSQ